MRERWHALARRDALHRTEKCDLASLAIDNDAVADLHRGRGARAAAAAAFRAPRPVGEANQRIRFDVRFTPREYKVSK